MKAPSKDLLRVPILGKSFGVHICHSHALLAAALSRTKAVSSSATVLAAGDLRVLVQRAFILSLLDRAYPGSPRKQERLIIASGGDLGSQKPPIKLFMSLLPIWDGHCGVVCSVFL